jgi:RND family efflux transporter MFP subunit
MEHKMKKIINKIELIVLLLVLVVITAGCGEDDFNTYKGETVKVSAETVEGSINKNIIELAGVVEGSKKAKLSTKLMGNITYFPMDAGAKITKGQVLAKIQSKDIEAKKQQVLANLSATEAAYINMKKNYDRIESLHKKGSATEKEFDDVTLGLKMTESQVKAAKEMKKEIDDVLSYSSIRAPFDGYIVNKFVQVGDIAAPGYPLMIVENFDSFDLTANVSADQINKVVKGMKVDVIIDALNDGKMKGEVVEVNPGAHPASRQYTIKVKLEVEDKFAGKIKSGMYARVLLTESENNKILIRENVIVKRGQLSGVYTINRNSEAVLRWLRLGKKTGDKYEVLSGLVTGEKNNNY